MARRQDNTVLESDALFSSWASRKNPALLSLPSVTCGRLRYTINARELQIKPLQATAVIIRAV